MPVVFVADEQDFRPIDTERWLKLANEVLTAEKVPEDVEVSVVYVDEPTIKDLNERFLGKTGPTDVLSFPIDETLSDVGRMPDSGGTGPGGSSDDDDADAATLLGDVVICPSIAATNAPDHAGRYDDELALLLVHGLLHLLGMDHEIEEDARLMEERERALLERFHGELPLSTWSTLSDTVIVIDDDDEDDEEDDDEDDDDDSDESRG